MKRDRYPSSFYGVFLFVYLFVFQVLHSFYSSIAECFELVVSGAALGENALTCLKNPNFLEKQTKLD